MRSRLVLVFFLPALFFWAPSASGSVDFGPCLSTHDPPSRVECVAARFEGHPPLSELLRAVGKLVPDSAGPAAEILAGLATKYSDELSADPGLRAWYLDLRGTAFLVLGRPEEAADGLGGAVALDDGTSRALIVDLGEGATRQVVVDAGTGRLERYVEALRAANRNDEADTYQKRLVQLGLGPVQETLEASRWYRPVPKTSIEIFGANPFLTEQAEGQVLILDFWASWCAPCLDELPHLQSLWESERAGGLTVIAINGGEPEEVAVPFAEDLGLTMPIGRSNGRLSEAFDVRTLPTLVIVDRSGRIRARWDGYEAGLEEHVARLTRKLLAVESAPRLPLAQVTRGAGRLGAEWSRNLPASIGGVAAVDGHPAGRVLLTHGDKLTTYLSDGQRGDQWDTGLRVRQLLHREAVEERPETVFGFRSGGSRFVTVELPSGEVAERVAPSPILDAAIFSAPADVVLIGTIAGLLRSEGGRITPTEGFEMVSAVHPSPDPGRRPLILSQAAEGGRSISLFDDEYSVVREIPVSDDAWGMVGHPAAPGQVMVTPPAVLAAAAGHFFSPTNAAVALATRSGQLVIVDLQTGEVEFRARWEDLSNLAAGDLDGDGMDELIVVSENRVTVLAGSATGETN